MFRKISSMTPRRHVEVGSVASVQVEVQVGLSAAACGPVPSAVWVGHRSFPIFAALLAQTDTAPKGYFLFLSGAAGESV